MPKPNPTDATLLAFIRTEINAGLLFAESSAGAGSNDHERRNRHRVNAEQAYESAVKFLERVATTADESAELQAGLETLRVGHRWPEEIQLTTFA